MSHHLSLHGRLPLAHVAPVGVLDLATLEELLVLGTVVIAIALFLIAVSLSKSTMHMR